MTDLAGTHFDSVGARFKRDFIIDHDQLQADFYDTTAERKDMLPWIKLAVFGMVTSKKGSLRHDANVLAITGVEGDYDQEKIAFEQAVAYLKAAKIFAFVYTSPSHTPTTPRWRVLCPFDRRLPVAERPKMVARLNGVLGGVLSVESFTLSQSYYFGHLNNGHQQAEWVLGDYLHERADLDTLAIGKNKKKLAASGNGHEHADYTDIDELRARIASGEALHTSVAMIAGKMVRNRVPKDMCISYVRSAFNEADTDRYEGRWAECRETVDFVYDKEESKQQVAADTAALTPEMFYYHSEENKFIFTPTNSLWQKAAVNTRLPPIGRFAASTMIAAERPVEQATWWPGKPRMIQHQLVHQGGLVDHPNARVYNYYRPPVVVNGNAQAARRFIDHVHLLYPDEATHILKWCACRVQRPDLKINHALVLGGPQGIGKDTLLFPVISAVGAWNVQTVSPAQVLEKFNPCLKSVVLLVTEARDMGEINRPQFYEHLKQIIAAPPDVLYINEKNKQQYYIPNLTGVVITTNHKAGGIYLSPEDRRHFIAWSTLEQKDFEAGYFERIWHGYLNHALVDDVGEYLRTLSLADFDPKAPPPKTPAFWEIVSAGQQPECADMETAILNLGTPDIVTLDDLLSCTADGDFAMTLRKSRRMIARWMEECGYRVVRNPDSKQGLWPCRGKKQIVYGKSSMPVNELMRIIRHKYL